MLHSPPPPRLWYNLDIQLFVPPMEYINDYFGPPLDKILNAALGRYTGCFTVSP